jgi:hypothetical protein
MELMSVEEFIANNRKTIKNLTSAQELKYKAHNRSKAIFDKKALADLDPDERKKVLSAFVREILSVYRDKPCHLEVGYYGKDKDNSQGYVFKIGRDGVNVTYVHKRKNEDKVNIEKKGTISHDDFVSRISDYYDKFGHFPGFSMEFM